MQRSINIKPAVYSLSLLTLLTAAIFSENPEFHGKNYEIQLTRPKPPIIDGKINDFCWYHAPCGHGFIQKNPVEGDVPSPSNPPKGCNFNTRCPVAKDVCFDDEPEFEAQGENHWVACFFAGSL